MKPYRLIIFILCFVSASNFGSTAFAYENPFYTIRKGEHLLQLFRDLGLYPLYGEAGTLQSVLELNEKIQITQGNYVNPHQRIYFSKSLETRILKSAQISPEGEITFAIPNRSTAASEEPVSESVPTVVAEVPFKFTSDVSVLTGLRYSKIEGYDTSSNTKAALGSDGSPSLDLTWTPHLSSDLSLDFGLQYLKTSITETATKTVVARDQTLTAIVAGANYSVLPDLHLSLHVSKFEQLTYFAPNATDLKLRKDAITQAALGLKYDFVNEPSLKSSFQAQYLSTLPFSNDVFSARAGSGYSLDLSAEHQMKGLSVMGKAFYLRREFTAEPVRFTYEEIGLGLGLKWTLGENE